MKEANRDVFDRGSLPEMLVQRARQASDRRLVLDTSLGLMAAASFAFFRPPLWIPLTALASCLVAFGAWGILDRELVDAAGDARRARVLSWARGVVAVLGGAAAVVFGVSLFFALLGPIIS
jgi:hypothetical protein